MRKKSAFTLIELLVVIAIIAILAALLFPSIRKFFENGKAVDDAGKLHSLGHMISLQMTDAQDSFFESGAGGEDTWPKVINRKYGNKDWGTFRSKFDRTTTTRPQGQITDPVPVSYGLNPNLFDTYAGKWKASRPSLIVAAPALTPDENEITFKPDAFSTSNVKLDMPSGNGSTVTKHGTHDNRSKINVLFADWHVQAMDIQKFEDSGSERGQGQWKPDYEPGN